MLNQTPDNAVPTYDVHSAMQSPEAFKKEYERIFTLPWGTLAILEALTGPAGIITSLRMSDEHWARQLAIELSEDAQIRVNKIHMRKLMDMGIRSEKFLNEFKTTFPDEPLDQSMLPKAG